MVQRELTAADLDDDLLLQVVRTRDPLGVLSIYMDAQNPRAGAIEVKNRLADLERRLASNGSAELADAVPRLIRRITPALERLVDTGATGRGRALFAPLGRSEVTTFSTQLRLPNRVVLDSSPFIHPLLELLERGRPAGVVLLSAEAADLFDWRLGESHPVARITAEATTAPTPRQRTGAVAENGPNARQITPLRDRKHDAARSRLLATVAVEIDRLAEERGWERILVSGSERLVTSLVSGTPGPPPGHHHPRTAAARRARPGETRDGHRRAPHRGPGCPPLAPGPQAARCRAGSGPRRTRPLGGGCGPQRGARGTRGLRPRRQVHRRRRRRRVTVRVVGGRGRPRSPSRG